MRLFDEGKKIFNYSGQTVGIPIEKTPWIVEGFIPPEEFKE